MQTVCVLFAQFVGERHQIFWLLPDFCNKVFNRTVSVAEYELKRRRLLQVVPFNGFRMGDLVQDGDDGGDVRLGVVFLFNLIQLFNQVRNNLLLVLQNFASRLDLNFINSLLNPFNQTIIKFFYSRHVYTVVPQKQNRFNVISYFIF